MNRFISSYNVSIEWRTKSTSVTLAMSGELKKIGEFGTVLTFTLRIRFRIAYIYWSNVYRSINAIPVVEAFHFSSFPVIQAFRLFGLSCPSGFIVVPALLWSSLQKQEIKKGEARWTISSALSIVKKIPMKFAFLGGTETEICSFTGKQHYLTENKPRSPRSETTIPP